MKLLLKTSLYFLTVSTLILFFGGIFLYAIIRNTIDSNVNAEMFHRMHKIALNANDSVLHLMSQNPFLEESVGVRRTSGTLENNYEFKDTILLDNFTNSYIPTRKLAFIADISGNLYEISIYKSLIQTNDLIERITLFMTFIFILFLVGLFFLNKYFFRKIWYEFFETLEKLKNYNINEKMDIQLVDSYIAEFKSFNDVIHKMLTRIKDDYLNLKEFTENISHEIQTPLAIIQSKLDLFIQFQNLTEEQFELILIIKQSVSRLSEYNKTLILLARIENNQFPEKKNLNLKTIIENHVENFEDFIAEKEISITTSFSDCNVQINETLCDILVMNLLKNAIKHNIHHGKIDLKLTEKTLVISNTGKNNLVDSTKVFDRFYSHSENQDSIGLGMAIVKKICELNAIQISYIVDNNEHSISLNFFS